ncbi:MAG: methyltransferase domain-containing protein [Pedobacter sp.]|nr:methyltransferase domain-containing protein [Pedobacter sp.]
MEKKEYWESVFTLKNKQEVSWTQENPENLIAFIDKISLPKTANIIDIGAGECFFAEILLDKGFTNIWVLDISEVALNKAKKRLGEKAKRINWITADITEFNPPIKFDFWNDRAVFHFLTTEENIEKYIHVLTHALQSNAYFLLGTFSELGPKICSGLPVKQYSEQQMRQRFNDDFTAMKCFKEQHQTPFNTIQEFQFCGFQFTKKLC